MTEFKTDVQTNQFSYRIEPKPEGGFVAKPAEPGLPTIEGATREEVQQKIQEAITDMIGKQLPAIFKLGNLSLRLNSNINFTTRTQSNAQTGMNALSNAPVQSSMLTDTAPIGPERSSSAVLWVLAGLMLLAALIYFSYLHK
jgi:predicted RNase H-like HicB family nuclease